MKRSIHLTLPASQLICQNFMIIHSITPAFRYLHVKIEEGGDEGQFKREDEGELRRGRRRGIGE